MRDNPRMSTSRVTLIAALLLCVSAAAFAQTPTDPRGGEGAMGRDKGVGFLDRYADELRARKVLDRAHQSMHTAAFRQALHAFAPGSTPELRLTWGEFMTASGTVFVALQLAPPASAIANDTKLVVFGEVVDANGKVVDEFEEPAPVVASKQDRFVERTLVAPIRGGVGTFGLARGREIVAIGRTTFTFDELSKSAAGVSPLIVSNNVYNLSALQSPLDPFAFGGTKVVPKPDRAFGKHEEIWLFTELRNPTLGTDKLPKVTTKIDVAGNGKKISGAPTAIEAFPLKGVEGHYGVGTTVDLSKLPAGEYTVTLTVRDELANSTYGRSAAIRIVD
jgi:hypothetical protein